jgi:hypothetical protein
MDRHLSDWIEGYLEYNKDSEPPESFLVWSAVSAIAAALQRKTYFQLGQLTFYPNLYIILCSPPGQARKGTAMKPAGQLLNELQIPMSAESITRARLINRLKECTDVITHEEGTIEEHCSITIFSKEFTVFLGQDNAQLMADLTDWFDCHNEWSYETKTSGMDRLRGVYVNLIGATTPDLIQSSLPLDAIGGGLTSRMLIIYEQWARFKSIPIFALTEEGQGVYQNLLHDLHQILMLRGQFKMTKETLEIYYDWYLNQPERCPFNTQRFSGYWSRRQTHLIKLMMIISAAKSNDLILTLEDFNSAKSLLTKAERKMEQAFSGVGRDRSARIIPQIIKYIAEHGEVTYAKLLNYFISDTNDWELQNIVRALRKVGVIDVTETMDGEVIKYVKETC